MFGLVGLIFNYEGLDFQLNMNDFACFGRKTLVPFSLKEPKNSLWKITIPPWLPLPSYYYKDQTNACQPHLDPLVSRDLNPELVIQSRYLDDTASPRDQVTVVAAKIGFWCILSVVRPISDSIDDCDMSIATENITPLILEMISEEFWWGSFTK